MSQPLLTIKFCTLTTSADTTDIRDDINTLQDSELTDLKLTETIHEERRQLNRGNTEINLNVWKNNMQPIRFVQTFLKTWVLECRTMTLKDDEEYNCHYKKLNQKNIVRCTILHFEENQLQMYILYYNLNKIQFIRPDDNNNNQRWYYEFAFLNLILNAAKTIKKTDITVNSCITQILKDSGNDNCKGLLISVITKSEDSFDTIRKKWAATVIQNTIGRKSQLNNPPNQTVNTRTTESTPVYGKKHVVTGLYLTGNNELIIRLMNGTSRQIIRDSAEDTFVLSPYSIDITDERNLFDEDEPQDDKFILIQNLVGVGSHFTDWNVPQQRYNASKKLPDDTKDYLLFHVYKTNGKYIINNIIKADGDGEEISDDMYINKRMLFRSPKTKENQKVLVIVFLHESNNKWKCITASCFDIGKYASNASIIEAQSELLQSLKQGGGTLPADRTSYQHRYTRKQKHIHPQKYSRGRRHRNHV